MKKIVMMVVLAVCLMATVVNAKMTTVRETYVVQAGDTVYDIAKKFEVAEREIVKDNPWVISLKREQWNGRELILFVKREVNKKTSTGKPGKRVWKWKYVGKAPFKGRDIRKAIGMFSIPNKVKIGLFAAIEKGEFKPHRINIGDRFKQMISGNYKLYGNEQDNGDVVADFDNPAYRDGLNADLYQFDYDGQRYFLVKPYVCMNWSWWVEDIPAPKEELTIAIDAHKEESEKIEEKEAASVVSLSKTDPWVDNNDEWIEDSAEEKIVLQSTSKKATNKDQSDGPKSTVYRPRVDMTAFGGLSKRVVKIGNGEYYGGDFTGYPIKLGMVDVGINVSYVQYKGYDYDDIAVVNQYWSGNQLSYGIAAKANFKDSDVVLKAGQIVRNSQFENSAGYRNKEKNDGFYLTIAPTWTFRKDKFFHTAELSGTYKLYNTGKKESWQNNVAISPVNDPQTDPSELYLLWKTEFYRFNNHLAWMVGTSYWGSKADSSVTVFTGPKITFGHFELTATGGHESSRVQPGKWRGDAALNFRY